MTSLTSLHHPFRVLAMLAVPVLLAAGCGGSPSNGNQSAGQTEAQALKWVQCMNQHGVPASQSNNGQSLGVHVHVGDKNAPGQQKVQAAQQACKQYQPNGGSGGGQASAQRMDQATKYVQCLNQHGASAQVAKDGGIIEGPGPGGPSQQQQADNACKKYQPGGGS
jgi:hypothetical protein